MIWNTISYLGGFGTFALVLLALPMALDLLGPPSFLLLSLLFTLHHFLYSTLRLALRNTPLAPLLSILSFISPIISAGCVSLTLYYYLHPPHHSFYPSYHLVHTLPYIYAGILRWVSPLFTLLEGVSTLLVIQVAGRVGRDWADEEEQDGFEWKGIVGLVAAALVYSAGVGAVIISFPKAAFPAFLLGAALASVLFLSLIGFTLRRTNVLETSLVFVYVVYSAWLSKIESGMEPRQFGAGWFGSAWAVPKQVNEVSVNALAKRATINVMDSMWDVAQTLPPHVLLSLIYRVAVLHMATRIVPVIRETSLGGEDPPNMRITTVVLSYRRAILIAVYTHLLLLDAGSQTWWRWINIALFLAVWSLELMLEPEDDTDSVSRWKVE